LKNIVPVPATNCAFINFKTREEAEHVAEQLSMRNIAPSSEGKVKVSLGEEEVGVQWGRTRKPKAAPATAAGAAVQGKQEQAATA